MIKRAYGCALALLLAIPLFVYGMDGKKAVLGIEASFGTDGPGLAAYSGPVALPVSFGFRISLGFEGADYRFDDPTAALAIRWNFFGDNRWDAWAGAEAGGAWMNTGYDSFVLPFVGITSGLSFTFWDTLAVFLEAGLRYGTLTRERSARLQFLETRYRETVWVDPFAIRTGVRMMVRE